MTEAILDPSRPIIDPLVAQMDRPWHGFDHIIETVPKYLLAELLADMGSGHNVIGTVYMECGAFYKADGPAELKSVGEIEFVNGVAAMSASGLYGDSRACAGIVGHVDLTMGSAAKGVLEALSAAGGGRFRGIRHSASADEDPTVLGPLHGRPAGIYLDPKFREGFAALQPLGMSFDAWLLEPQLEDLIDLVKAFPSTQFILDHVGTPVGIGRYAGKRDERYAGWQAKIRTLAGFDNVACKVGGLAMCFPGFDSFMSKPPMTSAQLAAEWKPYVETVIEAFGAHRCMFESNFPVDIGACDYRTLWNAFKHLAAGASESEKSDLFAGTARRIYKLDI